MCIYEKILYKNSQNTYLIGMIFIYCASLYPLSNMISKTIQIDRELQTIQQRKVTKDSTFRISIPVNWVKYLNIEKGQFLTLELMDDGFHVKV